MQVASPPQMHECTNARIHRCTNPQIHTSTNPHIHKSTKPQSLESKRKSMLSVRPRLPCNCRSSHLSHPSLTSSAPIHESIYFPTMLLSTSDMLLTFTNPSTSYALSTYCIEIGADP
ncbi:hypothetical protein ACMFMF_005201 [Clarireedia jacksonii]